MRKGALLTAACLALVLSACGDTEESADEAAVDETTPAEQEAQDALGEAGESAGEALEALEEAGRAGVEAVEERAPELREGAENVGERLRNAGEALVEDPDPGPMDEEGDSSADADEIPEAEEDPPTPN